ncbi:head-tail joining protein [Paraburkholderia bryophila]|uniref:Uncharacterized protein n=1 Tax=Paraburkholderia bryophila TaxID=420952 RepID=A0A7Z0AYJ0_9BURK|nr:hypothetical protein [Paraburkholderia bryophila]
MFDPGLFWTAFSAVGMLKTAQVVLVDGSTRDVQVGFTSPDMLDLGVQVTASEYQVEYQTTDMPVLVRDAVLVIDNARYKVRRPPRRKDDGYFSVADLEKLK